MTNSVCGLNYTHTMVGRSTLDPPFLPRHITVCLRQMTSLDVLGEHFLGITNFQTGTVHLYKEREGSSLQVHTFFLTYTLNLVSLSQIAITDLGIGSSPGLPVTFSLYFAGALSLVRLSKNCFNNRQSLTIKLVKATSSSISCIKRGRKGNIWLYLQTSIAYFEYQLEADHAS